MALKRKGSTGGSKRKLNKRKPSDTLPQRIKKPKHDEEILSSGNEEDNLDGPKIGKDFSDDEIYEDAQAKSFREAKRVLDQLKPNEKTADESDEDLDAIAHRLKKDSTEQAVRTHRQIADKVVIEEESVTVYKPHRFSPVCVALSHDGRFVVSCSKDGSIIKYDVESKRKKFMKRSTTKHYHKGEVKCVAISGDDKYLVSGGDDKIVRIWLLADLSHVKNFQGHKGPITSLVFRQGSNELYSASTDKCIRAWDLNQMGFVEIMYGHADAITQLDILEKPKLLSAGSTDRTAHLFKVEQSSQLVFNGLSDCISIDTVSMINDDHFVSGQMDGSLYVWSALKKKPVCVVKTAHGLDAEQGNSRWIVSVTAFPYSDLVASGSSDGKLKLWKIGENYKSLVLIDEFQMTGFINDIRFSADGKTLVCAVGQEHRSGRWWKCQEARNSIVILKLQYEGDQKEQQPADNPDLDSD